MAPNEEADANVVVTELSDWAKQSEMVSMRVDELMAGNKLDAILCVAGGWAGGNAKSKSLYLFVPLCSDLALGTSILFSNENMMNASHFWSFI